MTQTERDPNLMWISASQLDDFLDCPRRWWFKRVMKLPEMQKGYFTFGTVLHGCIERWMAGDKQGRVPAIGVAQSLSNREFVHGSESALEGQFEGQPVDVFPEGWESIDEKGSKVAVTPNEAKLIKKLFTEAVEKGILVRSPFATVEREIILPVIEGVALIGYIDIHFGNTAAQFFDGAPPLIPEIHDHKSFGESSVRYLKQPGPKDEGGNLIEIVAPYEKDDGTSPNSVGHNQQVLTYGAATSILDGWDGPVLLRHNQYPKFQDAKGVRKVEALVSADRLKAHWASVQSTAIAMLRVSKIKKWTDTPPPSSIDSCSRFGGCPFQQICGKRETPELYSKRVETTIKQRSKGPRPNLPLSPRNKRNKKTKDSSDMATPNIFARAQAQQAARTGAPAPTATTPKEAAKTAANPPKTTAPKAATPAPAPVEAVNGAPWANPNCTACKGLGVNSKGRACPICDQKNQKSGERPTSSLYVLELGDDSTITAVAIEEHIPAIEALGAETAWAGIVPKTAAGAPTVQTAPKATTKPKPAPAPEPEPQPEVTEELVVTEDDPAETAVETPAEVAPTNARGAAVAALTRGGTAPASAQAAPKAATAPKTPKPASEQGTAGRPRTGIAVLIGTVCLKGPERPRILAAELLEKLGAELAADMGAESYWTLDPFKRRERIRQRAGEIAESLGRTVITVSGGTNDPDVMSMVNGLIAAPCCEFAYEALR